MGPHPVETKSEFLVRADDAVRGRSRSSPGGGRRRQAGVSQQRRGGGRDARRRARDVQGVDPPGDGIRGGGAGSTAGSGVFSLVFFEGGPRLHIIHGQKLAKVHPSLSQIADAEKRGASDIILSKKMGTPETQYSDPHVSKSCESKMMM